MVKWQQFEGTGAEFDRHISRLGGGIYQSFGWGEARRGAGQYPLRMVALRGSEIVAITSVLVRQRYGISVCFVPGGPAGSLEHFGPVFRKALVKLTGGILHYCRLAIEIASMDTNVKLLEGNGWRRPRTPLGSGLTMHYSLSGDEDERINRATANWRHNLRRSSRHGLIVEQWHQPDVTTMEIVYREMEALKSLPPQHSHEALRQMLEALGERLIVYRCLDQGGNLICFRAAGLFGNRAWDLLAGATSAARKIYGSYATIWALMDHCKKIGVDTYDLSGVDPIRNKGVFDFKHGVGSELVQCLGEWEWASFPGLALPINWVIAWRDNHKMS